MTISDCLLVLFVLMILQLVGTHMQIKRYRRTVSKLHKLGNLGVGSNRKRFGAGSIVIISCANDGTITGCEEMRGFTVFSGFNEVPELVGQNIYELKAEYTALPEDEKKSFQSYIQALEALEIRLNSAKQDAQVSGEEA